MSYLEDIKRQRKVLAFLEKYREGYGEEYFEILKKIINYFLYVPTFWVTSILSIILVKNINFLCYIIKITLNIALILALQVPLQNHYHYSNSFLRPYAQ